MSFALRLFLSVACVLALAPSALADDELADVNRPAPMFRLPVYNAKASALNDWLFANAKHIADWNAVVTAGYMKQQPVVLDGLHPNEDGKAQYAQIISDALDTCPS